MVLQTRLSIVKGTAGSLLTYPSGIDGFQIVTVDGGGDFLWRFCSKSLGKKTEVSEDSYTDSQPLEDVAIFIYLVKSVRFFFFPL